MYMAIYFPIKMQQHLILKVADCIFQNPHQNRKKERTTSSFSIWNHSDFIMVSLVKLFIKREFRQALEVVVFVLIRGSQNLKRECYNCYLQYFLCRYFFFSFFFFENQNIVTLLMKKKISHGWLQERHGGEMKHSLSKPKNL